MFDFDWFDMGPEKKPRLATASWVPLFQRKSSGEREYPDNGWWRESISSVAVFFPASVPDLEQTIEWMDVQRTNGNRPEVSKEDYIPAREYYPHGVEPIDGYLVSGDYACMEVDCPDGWEILIEPDLICALGLARDGENWIYPHDAYATVIRQSRDQKGRIESVEIRGSFLKDYLCARNSQLFVASFRHREQIFAELPPFELPQNFSAPGIRYECRDLEITDDGGRYGVKVGTFISGRTDVDPHDDVPVMEFAKDGDTWSESHEFVRNNGKKHRIIAEMWKNETIQPGSQSPIVRDDEVEADVRFVVDNDATTMVASQLIAPPSRWLWFTPKLIQSILDQRDTHLIWYTEDTGGICLPDWSPIHFGVNQQDLVNIYAKDVGQLSIWWQQLFASHNVAPDGKVSRELMASQMECKPAETFAPEQVLPQAIEFVEGEFNQRYGLNLFREHDSETQLWSTVHRFAATDETELFKLMKNLTRLCIERLDIGNLKKLTSELDKSVASIKRLEAILSTTGNDGRRLTSVLVGVNELRQRDSHLPSSKEVDESFKLVGIDRQNSYVKQAKFTIENVARCFIEIGRAIGQSKEVDGH